MQSKFDQQVASFATQAKKKITPTPAFNQDRGSRRPKRVPYTVAAWRLVKNEDKITVNDRDFHWCTGDHYRGGVKHNRMYANHKSSDHGAWRKSFDDAKANQNSGKTSNESPSLATVSVPAQKLALNDKLQNSFCTQAGLSAEAIDYIWDKLRGASPRRHLCTFRILIPYYFVPYIMPLCHSTIPPFRHSAITPFRHSAIPPFRHSAIPPFRHSVIPPFRHSAILPFRHSTIPPFRSNMQ
jgi:hypothetical protein